MREEAADRDVVDRLPTARADVGSEDVEISGVSLDRVRRGVTLPQVAQEVIGRAFDDGALMLLHGLVPLIKSNSPQRHRDTEECEFITLLSHADDVSCKRSSADRVRRGYKSASWKCRRGRGWSALFLGRPHSPPYASRRSGVACADWRGVLKKDPRRVPLFRPTARPVDGSAGGPLCPETKAANLFF